MALEKNQFDDFSQKKDARDDLKKPFGAEPDGDLEGAQPIGDTPFGTSDRSVGARIAPVLPHLAGYDFGDDDTGSDILGKQIELEAGNAIQYRTCSWPKASRNDYGPHMWICYRG
jgi:hypothetical protein